jgi:hypothetical protein
MAEVIGEKLSKKQQMREVILGYSRQPLGKREHSNFLELQILTLDDGRIDRNM